MKEGADDSVFILGSNESYFGGIYESRLRFITNDPSYIIVDTMVLLKIKHNKRA